jgi:hypothetical protein
MEQSSLRTMAISEENAYVRYRLRENIAWSKNKGSHMVSRESGFFLVNYGSRRGPLS